LHHEIVTRARAAGLAGATVLRGDEGYGTSSRIHTTRLLSLAEDLPVVVIIIDTQERVRAFLSELDELITEGTVVLDAVEVLRYAGKPRP
jgi:PII-like signaling protein